jgi:hypothetical protein
MSEVHPLMMDVLYRSMNGNAGHRLTGERLVLRPPRPTDRMDRLHAGRDPEFRRMVGGVGPDPGPLTAAEVDRWYGDLAAERRLAFYAGETDGALEYFEAACVSRAPILPYFEVEPMTRDVRSDPRFSEIARRHGLPLMD